MRLIDADAFLKRNEVYADCEFLHPMYQNTLREIVDDAPTIDAVPVRHGEWKPFDLTYGRSIYYCSVCKQATEVPMSMEKPMYAYCPNCGARMDGERREG